MPQLDFTQPPFDVLSVTERLSLRKHTQVRYLATGESLPAAELCDFFVVIKGRIEQRLATTTLATDTDSDTALDTEFVAAYTGSSHAESSNGNDWFDSRRQPEGVDKKTDIPPTYHYIAREDTLLLQIEGSAIDRLSAQNHLVRELLSDKLPERLKALRRNRHHRGRTTAAANGAAQQEVQQIMLQPVTDIQLLPVQTIDADSTLYQAAKIMTEAGIKHVLVRQAATIAAPIDPVTNTAATNHTRPSHQGNSLLGILTDTDICRAISEAQDPHTTPCHAYTCFTLRTIDAEHDIGDALLAMTRYRVHRLPVLNRQGQVMGILGQSNLLAHIGHHSQLISTEIEQAVDIGSLHKAVDLIGRYIRTQQQNGVKISIVSRMVQTLNVQVFTKLWQLIVPDTVLTHTCVIVMGSEGRGEQIMRTDQDNALIIQDGFSHPELAQYAHTFNQHLATLGYPLCDGNIMMNNPLWRLSISDFKTQISMWFRNTDPMHSIYLSALLDGEYVCGDETLLTQIREHLQYAHRQADPMFVRQFARAALQFGEINQWWQKFAPLLGKSSHPDIDLKKAGIFPLVHGIRALALEHDILHVPSTKGRLKALVQVQALTAERAETLYEALAFFMAQRLAVALITEDKHARQVDPTTLSALERDVLKECLAVVKSFKAQLRQHYQLEIA